MAAVAAHECLEVMSVTCSHTTAVLNAVEAGVKHANDKFCYNGRVNKDKLLGMCPKTGEALEQGLDLWFGVLKFV